MDAKSKANFINSVAAGEVVPCPNCGAANKPEDTNCVSCGTALAAPAFAPAETEAPAAEAFAPVAEAPAAAAEPVSVFAEGLPAWDIVPPQVVVRRH